MAINRQNLIIAGLPNFAAAAVTSVTLVGGGAGPAGMPISNTKTQEPWEAGRVPTIFPHECGIEAAMPVPKSVEAIALVNHSLIPGDALRVVGVSSGALPAVRSQSLLPDAIVASVGTGFFGAVTDIDEHPEDADAALMGATADAPWGVTLSFVNPAAAPGVGAATLAGTPYQCFVLWVEGATGADPADPNYQATVQATLLDSGDAGFFLDLGTKAVNLGGQLMIFPWAADDLPTADGSGVQVQLNVTSSPDIYTRLDAIRWETVSQTVVDAADLDTGWITMGGAETEAAWGGTAIQEVDLPSPLWHELFVATSLQSLRVEFRADGLGFWTDGISTPPRTPSGFVDVGVLLIAPAFEVPYNFAPGATLRSAPVLIGGEEEAITGSKRAVAAFRRRTCELRLDILPQASAHSLFARLDSAAMGVSAFLLVLEPGSTDPTIQRNTTFWAVAEESQGLLYIEGFDDVGPVRAMGYSIEEKL